VSIAAGPKRRMGSLASERKVVGWAAREATGHLSPYTYTLRYAAPPPSLDRSCSSSPLVLFISVGLSPFLVQTRKWIQEGG